ncbi:MAG: TonB-dependent receptor [Chitinivibrionales bacterium]|nr:TonB-dependent receptor [Chitinivibrionales bacterium]
MHLNLFCKTMCSPCFALALVLPASGNSAQAEKESDTTRIDYELGRIVVRSPRNDAPATVYEINTERAMHKGELTVTGALESIPGITISSGPKNETDVKIRGVGSRHVLVMLDGRPLNMPYYGKVDLSTIPLGNVARIVVTKGCPSLLYGVNGPAGVVNIVTSNAMERDSLWAGTTVFAGPNSTWGVGPDASISLRKWYAYASLHRSASNGYQLARSFTPATYENGGLRDNSDFDRLNVNGKIGYSFTGENEAAAGFGMYREEQGVPSDIYEAQHRRFVDWNRWFTEATAKLTVLDAVHARAKIYYDNFANELIDYANSDFVSFNWDSFHRHWDAGGLWLANIPIDRHAVDIGIHGKTEQASTEGFRPAANQPPGPLKEFRMHTASATVEYSYALSALPLTVETGLQYSESRALGDDKLAGGFKARAVDGRIGSRLTASDMLQVYAGAGAYTRYPTLRQLSSEESGNPDLEAERTVKVEIGAEFVLFRRLATTQFVAFSENYRNMIDRYYNQIDKSRIFFNRFEVWSRGVEVLLGLQFERVGPRVDVGYTLNFSRDVERDISLSYVPLHSLKHEINQVLFESLTLYYAGRAALRRADESGNDMENYYTGKIRVAFDWRFFSTAFTVDNLFDADYSTEHKYYPMPGRTFRFDLEIVLGRRLNI